jgi:hypothetical protein
MAGLLVTDGYKFSMAEAGCPLREETFYASHRRGGLQVLPFDVEKMVRAVLPVPEAGDWDFLAKHDYEMSAGFKAAIALASQVRISALPKNAVFHDREPICCITGPSAVVSWLEPLVLMWSYRVQVATVALLRPDELAASVGTVTCEAQKRIVLETLDAVGVKAPGVAPLVWSSPIDMTEKLGRRLAGSALSKAASNPSNSRKKTLTLSVSRAPNPR